jgi:hypothetical protein
MNRLLGWTQKSVASVTGVALAASLILLPMVRAVGATEPPLGAASAGPAKSATQIDPHWRALIDAVESQDAARTAEQVNAFNPIVHIDISAGTLFGRVDKPALISVQTARHDGLFRSPKPVKPFQ